jgi:DNA-directed RNA polymerase sigma subunit (sigma70/sigma32)
MNKTIKEVIIKQLQEKRLIYPFVADLMVRERAILEMRKDPKNTLDGIGEKFGITRERVRQIEKKAKDKLDYQAQIIEILATEIGKNVFTEEEVEQVFSEYLKKKGIAKDVAGIKVFWADFSKILWKIK